MQTNNNCIVIFGASGDLTHRKLIPALYNLFKFGRLNKFSVLGVARSELNDETFREKMREALLETEETTPETLDAFCSHLYYQAVNTSDAADYGKLVPRLEELHTKYQTNGNTLYYMSTPPSLYGVIPECLAAHGLNEEKDGWKRIIVEKPFGYDEKTAQELDVQIHRFFEEHQIYISTTSACSSKAGKPAGTLISMGVPTKLAQTAVRISLDDDNDMGQVEQFLTIFKQVYAKTQKVR